MKTTDRPMGRDELERHGALLFGYGWKSRIAEAMDVNRREVSRWIAADAIAPWAATKIRAMVAIAPPPGTTDQQDRDDACAESLEPELTRLLNLAEGAGWHRGEVVTAMISLAMTDIVTHAGRAPALDMIEQLRLALNDQ